MTAVIFTRLLKSNYCRLTFIISLAIITALTPRKIFYGYYTLLGIAFILTTALAITCIAYVIKEQVRSARANGASIIGIIATVLGFGALQTCTIGVPVCGASVGAGILAVFFPQVALPFFEKYGIIIVGVSILLQIATIALMGCFRRSK